MGPRNEALRYGWVSLLLHWLVVALVICQFVLAHFADQAHQAHSLLGQIAWLARHKSTGITILALAAVRLGWRVFSPPPPLPSGTPRWQRLAGRANQAALYTLLFALPLTGWAMSSAANFPVSYFGLFTLPNFVAPDDALKHTLTDVHHLLAALLLVFVALHVAGALKHQFIDRDGVLLRMLGRRHV